ncbi:MAG: ABC transporter permease [Lachnospiraceae bacterium]|nr:ABC transporter permease [Lachnospiraceae bacterium]
MHLYKNFFRLLKQNRSGIIIYGCIFVIMLVLLCVIAGSSGSSEGEFKETYDISYIDNDDSVLSRGLIAYLSQSNNVQDYRDKSESAILDLIFFGISEYHMTIDKGFGDRINKGEEAKLRYNTSFDMSSTAFGIDTMVNNYIGMYRDYRLMGYDENAAADAAAALLSNETTINVLSKKADPAGSGNELVVFQMNQFFCYLALGFLALGVGHTIIANNDENVGRRIEASCVSRKSVSLTNTLGLITAGIFIWFIFIIINIVFGHDTAILHDYWWLILINSFVTMLTGCSIASLLTSFNISSNSLSMITNIVSLSMCFACGVFVPQWLIGENVLKLARFMPFYWSVYANNMTYPPSGVAFDQHRLILCLGVQALFAVVIALAAAFVKSSRLGKV